MRVLLIDDHPLILSALQSVIEGLSNGASVNGVGSAQAAREILQTDASYDLVLLDLQLGDADGFDVLSEFRRDYPALPVVVVSASDRRGDVLRALDLGAMGFVPKRASNEALFDALRRVMSGDIYVPPLMLQAEPDSSQATMSPRVAQNLASLGLTPRQTEVLNQLLQGKPNKLIARELKLSVETVKDHVAAVLRTLNVSTRTQAVLAVSQMMQGKQGTRGSGA